VAPFLRTVAALGLPALLMVGSQACGSSPPRDGLDPAVGGDTSGEAGAVNEAPGADANAPDGAIVHPSDGGASDGSSGDASSDGGLLDAASDAGPISNDPFDPSSCTGTAMTALTATTLLGGALRVHLASSQWLQRTRTCDVNHLNCTPWGASSAYVISLVTYSGGVTTHSKNFAFPTDLLLANPGALTFVLRESNDYAHCATCDTRGIRPPFGASPETIADPLIRLWDPAPSHPEDYQDEYAYWPDATFVATDHCAIFSMSPYHEIQVAALYRY
jgi:hypothetical protein